MEQVDFDILTGRTFMSARRLGDDALVFCCMDGVYVMYHDQDCCEDVSIEDVCGNLDDLVGLPVSFAEESSSGDDDGSEEGTWTFYKLATPKGWVDVRWHGTSNGCYSERAGLYYMRAPYVPLPGPGEIGVMASSVLEVLSSPAGGDLRLIRSWSVDAGLSAWFAEIFPTCSVRSGNHYGSLYGVRVYTGRMEEGVAEVSMVGGHYVPVRVGARGSVWKV